MISCGLLASTTRPARADDIAAASHVVAVTVYADRASVTREAEVKLPAGASTVMFDNLPAGLDGNSIRAQGTAEAAVTLGAVDTKTKTEAKLAVPQEQQLQAQLQDLQDKRALLQADVGANDARKSFLESLGTAPPPVARSAADSDDPGASSVLKPEQWNAAANTLYAGMADTLKLGVSQGIAIRQIDQQVAALQAQMNSATGQRSSVSVSVPLEAADATTLTLRVTYQVPRATWEPIYDARLDTKTGKLDLTEYAKVRQATGEDWANVALTLSTAQPSQGAMELVLQTQWVYLMQRAVPMGSGSVGLGSPVAPAGNGKETPAYIRALQEENERSSKEAQGRGSSNIPTPAAATSVIDPRRDVLQEFTPSTVTTAPIIPSPLAPMAMPAPVPIKADFAPAQVSTGGYVAEFHIVGPATILPDNSDKRVMIGAAKAAATIVDQVAPAEDTKAYLVARTKLAGDAPLLPGAASLFRDGSYIGSENLSLLQPGEETPLSFGIDDQIVAKRQVLANERGSDGTFSKQNTQTRKVVTHIHNLHKTPVTIEVRESVPVARNDKITVETLTDDTTSGYAKDADHINGVDLWKLPLAADATSDVKLGWKVSWPTDETVIGLP